MSSHEKALKKLLTKHEYELTHTNDFGVRVFVKPGCTDLVIYPKVTATAALRFTQQILRESKKPEPENEWQAAERQRAEAQAARKAEDAARVKDLRLGGLSAVLTEDEVTKVARQAERDMAFTRQLEHLIRERPLGAGRKR